MDSSGPLTVVILILLVLASGFFSSAETAYTALNRVRLKNMALSGDERAAKVLKLAEDYDKLISSILIGNNIVNILASSLATVFFVNLMGAKGVTAATAVMTVAILLLGEVAPKTIARVISEKLAFAFYDPLKAVVTLLTPLNFLMGCWQSLMGRLVRNEEEQGVTEEELITLVSEAESGGEIDSHESELIRSAIVFNDMTVEDVLTPRVDVAAVPVNATAEAIAQRFAETGYSRLPVYEDGIDDIVGILHEKDFYRNRGRLNLAQLMSKPVCVLPSTHLSDMLHLLQRAKAHMGVVMDEYGGMIGIVTLEDILEELVGEIWDEHDEIIEDFVPLPDGSWRIQGSASLDDLEDRFGLKKEYESVTVNGWVLEEMGQLPQTGDRFTCEGLTVTIEKVGRRRVEQIRVQKEDDAASEEPPKK